TPALVGEDGGLIAGHARILAARQLGIAEIPVMVAAGWSEAQKRAYVLADNQLAITGSGWDPELLRLELGELKLGGFDLSLTGFGDLELKDLLAERTAGLTDPDDAPAAPEHQDSALYPFITQLERAAGFAREDTVETRLSGLPQVTTMTLSRFDR